MMLRNMVTSLMSHERIQTTLAKAKEVRKLADRVITMAKRGDLHARRQALALMTDKGVVSKLFSEIGPRFQNRAGGFTRLLRIDNRMGDGAPLSVVELTELKVAEKTEVKKAAKVSSKPKKKTPRPESKGERKPKKEKKAEEVSQESAEKGEPTGAKKPKTPRGSRKTKKVEPEP